MNVFPQRVVEVHIKKNLEMKILVLVMAFMTISAMVMVVVVVDGVLIFVISVEEDMDVIVKCILMMKIQVLGDEFHDDFRGHVGGRRAGHNDRRAGGERRHGRHVHFDDEEEIQSEYENGEFGDDDNPFASHGRLDSTMIVIEVLVMMEDIIVVVTIGMIRTALLESS